MGFFGRMWGAIKNMILGKATIEQALGIKIIRDTELETAQRLWQSMLDGRAPWNDDANPSLRWASSMCRKVSNNSTFEVDADLTGNDTLKEFFMDMIGELPGTTRKTLGFGSLVAKPFVRGNRILRTYATPDRFFPIRYNELGELTSVAFADSIAMADDVYTLLEAHTWDEPTSAYSIEYKAFHKRQSGSIGRQSDGIGREIPISSVPEWAHLVDIEWQNIPQSLFVEINMHDKQSLFAPAVDLLRVADEQYGRTIWEYESGERAIDASIDLFRPTGRTDGNGMREVALPKGKERLFRVHDGSEENNALSVFSPDFRDDSLFRGLNEAARRVELICGVGYGTISDAQEQLKTAKEVDVGTGTDKVTIADIQNKILEPALIKLTESMNILGQLYGLFPTASYDIAIEWGDMLADREAQRQQWKEEVAMGIMSPVEYRMRVYKETAEDAAKWIPAQQTQSVE